MKIIDENNIRPKPVYVIEEKPEGIDRRPEGEAPRITIETDVGKLHRLPRWVLVLLFTVILLLAVIGVGCYYHETNTIVLKILLIAPNT